MQYRQLGRSDLKVSVVCMGCWAIVDEGTWGPQDESAALAAIQAALDAGITFFDTAEGYGGGRSEELLSRGLAGRRHEAVIATKASSAHHRPADLRAACERSLRRLRSDRIDLYLLHWPSREVPFAETWRAMEDLQREGKVRVAGVSNFATADLADLRAVGRPEANQLPYSLLWRAIEHEVLPACLSHDISVTCYSPLAQGLLTGKFRTPDEVPAGRARTRHFAGSRPEARHEEAGAEAETFAAIDRVRQAGDELGWPTAHVALAWLLGQPGVTSVIAGARSPAQARENAAAGERKLPVGVVTALSAATEELKRKFGPNPDMWQTESRMR
jgi:aryl-alcohol dehydrogenase-like predicted oxidoreductase